MFQDDREIDLEHIKDCIREQIRIKVEQLQEIEEMRKIREINEEIQWRFECLDDLREIDAEDGDDLTERERFFKRLYHYGEVKKEEYERIKKQEEKDGKR